MDIDTQNLNADDTPKVVFMYSGQSTQYCGMGLQLYNNDTSFKTDMETCEALIRKQTGTSILNLLYDQPDEIRLCETRYAQPAIFALEYALSRFWQTKNIVPHAVIGHSIGEFAAGVTAGVFSLETAIDLVCARVQCIEEYAPEGGMIVVFVEWENLQPLISGIEGVWLAGINATKVTALSGRKEALAQVKVACRKLHIPAMMLNINHAFHSPMLHEALYRFVIQQKNAQYKEPKIPFFSTVTGKLANCNTLCNTNYWADNIGKPVLFLETMQQIINNKYSVFLEIGAMPNLVNLAKHSFDSAKIKWLASLDKTTDDVEQTDSVLIELLQP